MKTLIIPFCVLLFLQGYSQYKKPYFNRITVETGLPEGFIQCYLQDTPGYLWYGTQNGLVRYDGYKTQIYPLPGNDGKPLVSPSVLFLSLDSAGTVWTGVLGEGIYYYNRHTNMFVRTNLVKAQGYTLKQDITYDLIEDKHKGNYWIVGGDFEKNVVHLDLYDTVKQTVKHFYAGAKKAEALDFSHSNSVKKDLQGNIWASGDSLLAIYDYKAGKFVTKAVLPGDTWFFNDLYVEQSDSNIIWLTTTVYSKSTKTFLPGNVLAYNLKTNSYKVFANNIKDSSSIAGGCIYCWADDANNMWFMCKNKVSRYNRQAGNFTTYAFDSIPDLRSTDFDITCMAQDNRHNIWLAGNFIGMFLLQPNTGRQIYYHIGNNDAVGELPKARTVSMFRDKTGSTWAGFAFQGAASLNENRSFFNTIAASPPGSDNGKQKGKLTFYDFFPYNDSSVIVDIWNDFHGDIYVWNYVSNVYSKLNISLPAGEQASAIYKDREGCWWVSCFSQLLCYNPANNTTKIFKNNVVTNIAASYSYCKVITQDKTGIIWLGTWGNGICSFNKQTGQFTQYPFTEDSREADRNTLFNGQVGAMFFDKNGILWLGSNFGGLAAFNTKTHTFKNIYHKKDGLLCVTTIYQDTKGRLWAGTYMGGLFLINTDTYTYKRYSELDGLASDGIKDIAEDNAGQLWVVTNQRGISVFNPATGAVKNYNAANALPSNDNRHIFRSSTGMLTVAQSNGIMYFNPAELPNNNTPPFVNIESVAYYAAANNNDTILYTFGRPDIQLGYNENKITFNYVALHYTNPALNQYAYKLDGYDKQWVQAGTQRSVNYLNLTPGNYTFHVKACNSDGVWNETGASIAIVIYPPWWQTWWAYTLYAIAVCSAVWGFVYYRSKQLLHHNKLLEHKIKLRTAEVIEQKEEIVAQRDNLEHTLNELQATQTQLIQKEKMASLGELTAGIAHEIQNPLNFVNNFSEVSIELLAELRAEEAKGNKEDAMAITEDLARNLEKINHHGKRADAIVKGMLQHSRANTGQKQPTHINALADEYLRLSYQGLRAKDKGFNATMHTTFDDSIGKINIFAQDVGRVLLNLYNNAFYAVQEKAKTADAGYKPTVSVYTKKQGDKIIITVADNANGIPGNIKEKIFQPFFTTKPTGQGTGLGLSLSYDIIKAHGGEIKVQTNEGEGTEFIIKLPTT